MKKLQRSTSLTLSEIKQLEAIKHHYRLNDSQALAKAVAIAYASLNPNKPKFINQPGKLIPEYIYLSGFIRQPLDDTRFYYVFPEYQVVAKDSSKGIVVHKTYPDKVWQLATVRRRFISKPLTVLDRTLELLMAHPDAPEVMTREELAASDRYADSEFYKQTWDISNLTLNLTKL